MGYAIEYYAYFIVAAISAICSLFVASTLWFCGSLRTAATQLLLLVHLTLLMEEVSSLPYLFNDSSGLCTTMAFLRFYSGLGNAMSLGLLVISYRYHFMEDTIGIIPFIEKYCTSIVGILPLITLLPFVTNSYKNNNEVWCFMETDTIVSNMWAFLVFYAWAWVILIFSTIVLVYTIYEVCMIDKEMGKLLCSTTGMYATISILAWIPRSVARFAHFGQRDLGNEAYLYAYFPIYIAGIIYTFVFMREKSALLLFDRLSDWNNESTGNRESGASFSWEDSQHRSELLRSRSSSAAALSDRLSLSPSKRGVYAPLVPADQYWD